MRRAQTTYGGFVLLVIIGAVVLVEKKSFPLDGSPSPIGGTHTVRVPRKTSLPDPIDELAVVLKEWRSGKDRNTAVGEVELMLTSAELYNGASADLIHRDAPDGEKIPILAPLIAGWIIRSPDDCRSWLNTNILNIEDRDLLLVHGYAAWAKENPRNALDSAISNQLPQNVLRSVFTSWVAIDFDAAMSAFDASPDHVKHAILDTVVLLAAEHETSRAEALWSQFVQIFPDVSDQVRLGRALLTVESELADKLISLEKDPQRHAALLAGIRTPVKATHAQAVKQPRLVDTTEEEIWDETDASLESAHSLGNEARR